jgi:hypothetical protein
LIPVVKESRNASRRPSREKYEARRIFTPNALGETP